MKIATMKKVSVLAALAACLTAAGAEPVAAFAFEEGAGAYAEDSVTGLAAELTPTAKWAKGAFGGALATGAVGAGAIVRGLEAIEGADACTVFLRFRKEGPGSGKYPNLMTSMGWERGGMMFFCERGKSVRLRLRAGSKGPEGSWPVFKNMPEEKWSSAAFVFKRPQITVYANGKEVAHGKWDHPFVVGNAVKIGGWNSSDSFGGFIGDFRVWKGALGADEIASMAADSRYDEIEGYQDDGTGGIRKTEVVGQGGTKYATVDGDAATLTFDTLGCVMSLKEKATGRELVTNVTAFVSAKVGACDMVARRIERRGADRFAFLFGKAGEVELSVAPFKGGWTFAVETCTLKDVRQLSFCNIKPACRKWRGDFANAWSDEQSAVCVRSGDIKGCPRAGGSLRVEVDAEFGFVGRRALLAAGPRDSFREQLKAMTVAAGVPRSDAGGAWATGSEVSRWSYVFATIRNGDVESWIDFVKRAGFANLHFNSSWTDCLGHNPVSKWAFPGGLEEMKACAAKVHAAGLHAGMHTLTACICPRDSWIRPVCREDLVADATYTLAAPLDEKATEMLVEERPIDKHVNVFTYSSNGNVMRIGGELIQYSDIRRAGAPYAFTELKRGAFGTKRGGTYPKGTKVDYLHQRYIAFYPKPDSKLADELADRLAEVYNTCNLDEFYFDGSEGMGTRYGIDAMRHKIYSRLKANNGHSPSIEASCQGANNWWFQTRMATVDHGTYGVKRFHDWHITWAIDSGRHANFLEPQMGWWQPRTDVPQARGHMLDEMEYFAGKNAGHDAAMSIQGVSPRQGLAGVRRQLTVLGWYEWPRLARAFAAEAQEYLAKPGSEARLRQNGKGVWELTDVEAFVHRAGTPWAKEWNVDCGEGAARPAAIRVEALYAAGGESDVTLLKEEDFKEMKTAAASGVKVRLDADVATEHGKAFRLTAENGTAERKGAWARAEKSYGFSGAALGRDRIAFGMWVKGDGSGALLNLQFRTPPAFHGGISDHYMRLDFTGWRYVTVLLRERDASEFCRYVWPYGGYSAIYRTMVDPMHLGTFSAYLNDVPKGGRATVEVGEVRALTMAPNALEGASVAVNGESFSVPFRMNAGEYTELDGGFWTHYSARGEALARVEAAKAPALKGGRNSVAFDGGEKGRAEVTLFALGRTRKAFVDELTPAMKATMRYEGVMPFEYAPEKGLLPPKAIPVRPGEKVVLSLEIYGPATKPTCEFGESGAVCAFDAEIGAGERLVCRDGRKWFVETLKDGKTVKEGELATPLPTLDGTTVFDFSAGLNGGAPCVVDILKDYQVR